jgi:hypothetical protein
MTLLDVIGYIQKGGIIRLKIMTISPSESKSATALSTFINIVVSPITSLPLTNMHTYHPVKVLIDEGLTALSRQALANSSTFFIITP